VRRHCQMLVSISGAVCLKKEGKRWRMNLTSASQGLPLTGENSDHVDAFIWENGQITVHELSGILNISDGSVKTIVKQHLQYSKACAQWIPCLLTDEHDSAWLQVAQSLSSRYEQERDIFGFYHDNGQGMGALLLFNFVNEIIRLPCSFLMMK